MTQLTQRRRKGLAFALGAFCAFTMAEVSSPISSARAQEAETTTSWAMAEFGEPLYDESMTHWPYANPDAPVGGSITLGAFGSFDSLNPYILKGNWPRSIGLIGDSLMVGSGDELASAYGLIAETAEFPDDKSWIIFTLRPEARYHDGHPITAGDFAYTMEVIREHGRPFLKSFYEEIESWEVLDDHRIKFTFNTRDTMKPLMNVAGLSPLPKHWWETRDISKTSLEAPLGSGAYRMTAVDAGRSVTYERVPDYWAADLPVNRGLNNIERIRYDYYVDDAVMFEAFKAGKIDFRSENRSQRWATGYDIAPVKDGRIVKRAEPNNSPRGIQAYFMNLRRNKFQDPRVRQAIGLLYDFEAIQRTLLYGAYARIESYFPNSDFGASGPPTAQEAAILEPHAAEIPPEALTEAWKAPSTDGSGFNRRNQRQALGLLKEAGWELQGGNLINAATGEQMAIEFLIVSQGMERITAPFVRNLQQIGIDASMRLVDTSQYQVRLDDFDYDMVSVALNFFPPPGAEQRSYWGSAAADVRGSANIAGITNPAVDALIEQVIAAEDLETLKAANRAMDRVLLWNYYTVPMYFNDEDWLAYWNKFGFPETRAKYSVGFPASWWVDDTLAAQLSQ